ncbi:hypothetical protein SAMN05216353_1462 [Halobacillus alkaliphilus]|uniref:Lipoprotein n=1 Tax=Halobacillus alkaliphilus TaxID=396056 RepID=A0A1I2S1M1_9BACI|nr:hypothetical protein [Halobacillus alkaliphilus]SFG46640.1 hypothetical protein SAMN05216353_1462 [Halobacillus alkaliphilus]
MYKRVGIASIMTIITIFLAGCNNHDTVSVEGKLFEVDQEEETFVVFVGDELKEAQDTNQDKQQKSIEAFLVKPEKGLEVKGEVDSFNDLKQGQKVAVEIGGYEEKLVTMDAMFSEPSKLPSYKSKSVTVTPYSKKDIVQELRVEEGYGLYTYNPKPNEKGWYDASPSSVAEDFPFRKIEVTHSVSDVKNTEELLGLYEDSPTYIITDEKGIILKTSQITELNEFIKKLEKPK